MNDLFWTGNGKMHNQEYLLLVKFPQIIIAARRNLAKRMLYGLAVESEMF